MIQIRYTIVFAALLGQDNIHRNLCTAILKWIVISLKDSCNWTVFHPNMVAAVGSKCLVSVNLLPMYLTIRVLNIQGTYQWFISEDEIVITRHWEITNSKLNAPSFMYPHKTRSSPTNVLTFSHTWIVVNQLWMKKISHVKC